MIQDAPLTPALTPSAAAAVDELLARLFPGAAAVSNARAFAALDIKNSLDFELLNLGVLERIKIGKCSRVTVPSIRKVLLYGVPPGGERERGMIGHKGGPPLDDRLSDHNDCLRYKPSLPAHYQRNGDRCVLPARKPNVWRVPTIRLPLHNSDGLLD